jgi:ABC-type molybdate transport system substrate-binding protein
MLRHLVNRVTFTIAATTLLLPFYLARTADATSTNINLAVASNFYGVPPSNSAITDIILAFEKQYASSNYAVTVVDNGATSTLADHIISGNTRKVDLFLAADTTTPEDLLIDHFSLVSPYNYPPTPTPLYTFNYAQGLLAVLTNWPGLDFSCTTGTCGYNPFIYRTAAVADPALAPYGAAAQTLLAGVYGITVPSNHVQKYPNITATYDAVIARKDTVGFVALSAICHDGTYPTSGTSALVYFPVGQNYYTVAPPNLVYNYNPLTQAGIAVNRKPARTTAQNTELDDFVDFMTDFTTAPSPDSAMITTLKKYCYSAP